MSLPPPLSCRLPQLNSHAVAEVISDPTAVNEVFNIGNKTVLRYHKHMENENFQRKSINRHWTAMQTSGPHTHPTTSRRVKYPTKTPAEDSLLQNYSYVETEKRTASSWSPSTHEDNKQGKTQHFPGYTCILLYNKAFVSKKNIDLMN